MIVTVPWWLQVTRLAGGTPSASVAAPPSSSAGGDVQGRIKYLLATHPVVLFMKVRTADARAVRCGITVSYV